MIVQDLIVDRIVTLLRNAAPLAGVQVEADVDFEALLEDQPSAISVRLVVSNATYPYAGDTSPRDWVSRVVISSGARRDEFGASGRASSNLAAKADAAISADPSLQGLLTRPLQLIALQPDHERARTAIGVVDATYTCEHQTAWNALAA